MPPHVHHIVPRHMGGTDSKENLVELTIEEHAEAHKKLYEEHGKEQDRIAWKSLMGQMKNEERQEELSRIGGLNNKGKPKTEEHKKKISNTIKKMHENGFYEYEHGRSGDKISKAMMGNTNSKNQRFSVTAKK